MEAKNIVEVKNLVKEAIAGRLKDEIRQAAAISAKVAVAFVGASLGHFLRNLLKENAVLQEALSGMSQEERRAVLHTALAELWETTHRIFVETLKSGIRGGTLEANIFAEKIMRHLEKRGD